MSNEQQRHEFNGATRIIINFHAILVHFLIFGLCTKENAVELHALRFASQVI